MAYVRQHPKYPRFRMKVGAMPHFSGSSFMSQEKPKGIMNNDNRTFTIEHRPVRDTDKVYKDGMMMARSSDRKFKDGDYYINYLGNPVTIEFSERQIPQEKSVIRVDYSYMNLG